MEAENFFLLFFTHLCGGSVAERGGHYLQTPHQYGHMDSLFLMHPMKRKKCAKVYCGTHSTQGDGVFFALMY